MKAIVCFDGSSRPNPGAMKIGVLLKLPDREIEISKYVGHGANNVAEYLALIEGLKRALEFGVDEVEVYGDSTLVIEQVLGNYRVRNERLKELHAEVMGLLSKFKKWKLEWIPESENMRAHELSR